MASPTSSPLAPPPSRRIWLVEALEPDLFRFRFQRGPRLVERPSWAVPHLPTSCLPNRLAPNQRLTELRTEAGTFRINHKSLSWEIRDRHHLPVFHAPAGTTAIVAGKPRFALTLVDREVLLGLGEVAGPLNRRGLVRELHNTDVLPDAGSLHSACRRLYISVPLLLSLRDGRAAALFWDNPARQVWDLGADRPDRCLASAENGDLDLYLFLGPTLARIAEQYTALTGRVPLPPAWALGYHQSRYGWASRRDLEQIASSLRRHRVPCDALYLDIDHMDGKRVFTFGRAFPDPADMIRRLARRGFKVVTIVDPGVKDDSRFGVLRRGRSRHAFVKQPDGRKDVTAQVWPGRCRFPDFLRADVRAWWGHEQARLQRLGVAGFWNDMNEPATFDGPEHTLDGRCLHHTDHGPRHHAEVHNAYGSAMAEASRTGALLHRPAERPFIISRAGYAGLQRHALVWTGDISSSWEHLASSIPMLLNLGLSGLAVCGADVGGFIGHATPELLVRWTQLAAFTPFFRNHSDKASVHQEPWAFGPHTLALCRRYIEMRYQLFPYLYALLVEAHRTGTPIMRPLAWHFPNDPVAVACEDQFLLGPDLLVAPILRPAAVGRSVYLPPGSWYDAWTSQYYHGRQALLTTAGLDILPLYVRTGAILPMIDARPHLDQPLGPVANLHVWPGAPGSGHWYEDDGFSHGHEHGESYERKFSYRQSEHGETLTLAAPTGPYPSRVRQWRVLVRAVQRNFRVWINGKRAQGTWVPEAAVFVFACDNTQGPIHCRWS